MTFLSHRLLGYSLNRQSSKDFSKKWRDLIVDMNLVNFDEIPVQLLARDFIKGTAGIAPGFYKIWSNRLLGFDLDLSTSGLIEEPKIHSILDAFDL